MKAKYASAIRFGVEKANRVEYTWKGTNYYDHLASVRCYRLMNSNLENQLALKAFSRVSERRQNAHLAQKTRKETESYWEMVTRGRKLQYESGAEREIRLLRETVERMERNCNGKQH